MVESCTVWLRASSSAFSVFGDFGSGDHAGGDEDLSDGARIACPLRFERSGQVLGFYAFALDQSAADFSGMGLELFLFSPCRRRWCRRNPLRRWNGWDGKGRRLCRYTGGWVGRWRE